jgi:hypothetical protein
MRGSGEGGFVAGVEHAAAVRAAKRAAVLSTATEFITWRRA